MDLVPLDQVLLVRRVDGRLRCGEVDAGGCRVAVRDGYQVVGRWRTRRSSSPRTGRRPSRCRAAGCRAPQRPRNRLNPQRVYSCSAPESGMDVRCLSSRYVSMRSGMAHSSSQRGENSSMRSVMRTAYVRSQLCQQSSMISSSSPSDSRNVRTRSMFLRIPSGPLIGPCRKNHFCAV